MRIESIKARNETELWALSERQRIVRALLKVAEAARPGCCDELDADCDVRCDCAWGEVCAALTELEVQE